MPTTKCQDTRYCLSDLVVASLTRVVLIFVSLMLHDVEHSSLCLLAICVSYFEICPFWALCPFLTWVTGLVYCLVVNSFSCILDTRLLPDI